MCIDQSKMEFHLFFCQRSFHIRNTKTFREDSRTVQVLNILVKIHRTFHVTHFLIISQSKHGLQCDIYILVLHTSTIITRITLFGFRVIGNYYLTIVIHILIRLLACFFSIFISTSVRFIFILGNILISHTVLLVNLGFHDLKLILFRSFLIPNFSTGFRTLIISGQKVRILIDNSRIVLYGPTIITCLRTE